MTRMLGTSREPTLRGRDDQIGELRSAVDSAMSGRLSVVVIEGEAGIGKTRLLDQALQIAGESGCQVATAKAEEMEHGRPFGVIAAALGCARDAPDGRRATIANLISAHDSRDHGPLTVSSDPGLQFRVVDALCDLVESLATDRPLVLALDDLQWADPSSLVTLGALARTALGMPVALIACCRPFPRPPAMLRLFESLEHAGLRRIELSQLEDGDVRDVVAEVVGATPGPGLLGVVAGASGNPLFVTELLNAIVEDGSLSTTDGHAEVSDSDLPPSLPLTILGRLSSLPDEAIQVLRVASLLGSTFSITELATVLARPVTELIPAVEAILASGVLDEHGVLLRFRHDLIREAVYADMPSSLRLGLHREAAIRLADVGAPSSRVADQFARGATSGDPEAIDWLTRAAREAASTSPGDRRGAVAGRRRPDGGDGSTARPAGGRTSRQPDAGRTGDRCRRRRASRSWREVIGPRPTRRPGSGSVPRSWSTAGRPRLSARWMRSRTPRTARRRDGRSASRRPASPGSGWVTSTVRRQQPRRRARWPVAAATIAP